MHILWRILPFLALLSCGIYSILEVTFPQLRGSDFNRWEIDSDSASSIQIMGWKKVLSAPRVLASGYLSNRAACSLSLAVGLVLIIAAVIGIRHVVGFPSWLPDVVEKL